MTEDSIRDLWQKQEGEAVQIDIEELKRKARSFEEKIRRRNWREYAASVLVMAGCLWMLYGAKPWHVRMGAALEFAGVAYVCVYIYRKASFSPLADAALASREWYRRELQRQRDLCRGVWKWYLGPMVPGLVMWVAGGLWEHPERWGRSLVAGIIYSAAFVAVGKWNAHAARKLDKEMDSL